MTLVKDDEYLRTAAIRRTGVLIINADDWGRERAVTCRTLDCIQYGSVSSVSAMVFMADSEHAAEVARERRIDAGLHLNFTMAFSGLRAYSHLLDHQNRVSRYLRGSRLAQVMFHPGLARSFEYLIAAQLNEFVRLYGGEPRRLDGHHHMHLCANVILAGLLPSHTIVRRNFSFQLGEKPLGNVIYRSVIDRILARRHRLTDFFFSLQPLAPAGRLHRIFDLSRRFAVEVETHPDEPAEYSFLTEGRIREFVDNCSVAPHFDLDFESSVDVIGTPTTTTGPFTRKNSELLLCGTPVVLNSSNMSKHSIRLDHHISVCICTFKRLRLLRRLLEDLATQETDGLFTFSIVVADNDEQRSAEPVVMEFTATSTVSVTYCVEPQQNISLARNKAIENAFGDFIAFIDDDEFPAKRWLVTLFQTLNQYRVDGVLGPVKRHFDEAPPKWLLKSSFYTRVVYPTGTALNKEEGRTGNVLLKKQLFDGQAQPFKPELRVGEDKEFFRRMIGLGYQFIWSADAVAFEVVPPTRWRRVFILKRALFRGAHVPLQPNFGLHKVTKSLLAVPAYSLMLPVALLLGQHRFMILLVKLCDHLGLLLALIGIDRLHQAYITE